MANPVDTYRGQQGLTADVGGYHPDPQLVAWIKMAAKQTGADPVALMATSLQESGGRLHGPAGDKGTSFGPFQFHIGGALANHPPAWASTYPAILNRAQQFKRYQVRGGRGAAAVQGPADPALYAQGVDSLLGVAHAIIGGATGAASGPAGPRSAIPAGPARTVRAKTPIQSALDILSANTLEDVNSQFRDAGRMIRVPGTPARPAPTPVTTGVPGTTLTPGGGWEGTQALADSLKALGVRFGLGATGKRSWRNVKGTTNRSDHWTGSKDSFAYDLSNGTHVPDAAKDKTALAIATALGAADQWKKQGQQGVLTVNLGGYRYNMLYRTQVGGDHNTHVHIGVRKL